MDYKAEACVADFDLQTAARLSVLHYRPNAQRITRAALPEGAERAALLKQVKDWIAAAKSEGPPAA